MDSERAIRVANRTLEIGRMTRDGIAGHAVRFKGYRRANAYGWQPGSESEAGPILFALQAQLAECIKDWELIEGGRNGSSGSVVGCSGRSIVDCGGINNGIGGISPEVTNT